MGRTENFPKQPATAAAANLRNVSPYHPLVADTFGDWAVEAGDKVTLTKDGASYTSPVHETTLTWNGQPKLEIVSNGNEERAPIEKMAAKKYNSRGSTSGIRDASKLYTFEVNQKHLLYDVYNEEYGRLHACIEITSSALKALMEDWYNGLFGYLEMTASHLLVQFWGIYDGLSSQLELTRSALTVQFQGLYDGLKSYTELTRSRLVMEFMSIYDGLRSDLELTRSRLNLNFNDAYNGLYSGLEMTASRLRIWFTGLYDGLNSELEMTRSRLYIHFWGLYDGLSGELEMTRSRFWLGFNGLYDGLHGELEMTRSRFGLAFNGLYDGLHGELEMTRSRFAVAFDGLYDGLHGELEMTRSRLHVEFMGLYDGLSSELTFTRSRLLIEFQGLYDGLSSQFELTRSRMYVGFMGLYDGLSSSLEFTRSRLHVEFMGLYDGLSSHFELTRSQMYVGFMGLYDGMASQLEFTRSRLFTYFTDSYHGLEAYVESTASRWTSQLANFYEGLYSKVEQTASSWSAIVGSDGNIKPAKIQAAINKATGNSKITLSADHVELDGDAFASYLEGRAIGVQSIMADQIILNGGGQLLFYQDSEIGETEAANLIVNAYVDAGILHLVPYSGDEITFSKAATSKVSGTWSDGVYTVSADDNGVDLPISNTLQALVATSATVTKDGKHVSAEYAVKYGTSISNLYDTGFVATVSINAASVYNDGWDDARANTSIPRTNIGSNIDGTYATLTVGRAKEDRTSGTEPTEYGLNINPSFRPSGSSSNIVASELKVGNIVVARKTIPLQAKTFNSNVTNQGPDEGYVGFSKVTINVTAPYAVTSGTITPLTFDNSPTGYTKVTKTYGTYFEKNGTSGTSKKLRVYIAPKLTVDGTQLNSGNDYYTVFENLPSEIYADGYTAGLNAGSSEPSKVTGTWANGTYTVSTSSSGQSLPISSKIQALVATSSTVTKNGKYVKQTYGVKYGANINSLYDTGFTQEISINASEVYKDGWKDCYDTLDTTGTTATKTLNAGEQAVVTVKQTNKDGSVITRLSRTYTAPSYNAETDITIANWGANITDASNLGSYNNVDVNATGTSSKTLKLSSATGWYELVVSFKGSKKWYKLNIDASAVAGRIAARSNAVTANGTYYASSDSLDGYSSFTVSVSKDIDVNDFSIRQSNLGAYDNVRPQNYYTMGEFEVSHTTGYYTIVVDFTGNETGKWYKAYIDARKVYRDGWDYAAGKVHFYAYQSWVGGPARRGMSVSFPQTHTGTYTYPDTTQYFWLVDDTANNIVRLYKGTSSGGTSDEMCNIAYSVPSYTQIPGGKWSFQRGTTPDSNGNYTHRLWITSKSSTVSGLTDGSSYNLYK